MDKEHKLTDKRLIIMEKHIRAIYERANDELGKEWKSYLKEAGKEIEKFQKAYDDAKATGDRDSIKKTGIRLNQVKREKTLLDKHYKDLSQKYAEELLHTNETAMAYINGELPPVYALNYNQLADKVDGVGGYSFELTDAETVRNLATKNNNLLPYKVVNGKKDIRWNTKKVNSEVLQGILQGEPMDKIANRLSKVTGMNANSAIRNARTSVTSAENKGRYDSYKRAEKDGIILERKWVAAIDERTRDAHVKLNGKIAKIGEPFESELGDIMYPADPHADPANTYNCRCTLIAVVKGFNKVAVEQAMEKQQESINEDNPLNNIKMNQNYKTLKNYNASIESAEYNLKDSFELYRGLPEEFHKPFDEYEKLTPKFEKDLGKALKKFDFSTNTDSKALEKILKDGKLKSIMETKKSNGYEDVNLRKEASARLFFNWDSVETMKKNEFEKYGYLDDADRAKMYGNCKIVFKKENLWDRTTFTVGDSLASVENGRGCIPSWVGDPKIVSNGTDIFYADQPEANNLVIEAEKKRFNSIAEHGYFEGIVNSQDYVELQFHGEVTIDDIDYIKISKADKNANAIVKLAKEKGIKVKFR